jgi:hypothetical protein
VRQSWGQVVTDISANNWDMPGSRIRRLALPLTAATLFLSAFLLFSVQPFFAKLVLPRLGGSPAVWSVAMVFFQSVLLAGYGYAHFLTSRLPLRLAVILHVAVLTLAALALPIAIPQGWDRPPADGQAFWLTGLFAVSVGLPFFAVSANGPLLQAWFSRTGHSHAKDPYFLYGASNIGSFASLILYVALIEPFSDLSLQSSFWTIGFMALSALIAACGLAAMSLDGAGPLQPAATTADAAQLAGRAAIWRERLIWTSCAFLPSALLVAVTAHVSTDVAAVPFLWIAPLALFLLTFVIVFQNKPLISQGSVERLTPFIAVPLLFLTLSPIHFPIILQIGIHFSAFFVIALCAHGMLAARRPAPSRLTEFYFSMSIGGVLGGVFSSFLAMYLFSWIAEYPLLLLASLLTAPVLRGSNPLLRFSVCATAACLIVAGLAAFDQLGLLKTVTGFNSMVFLICAFTLSAYFLLFRSPQLSVLFCFLMFASAFAYNSFFSGAKSERSFFGVVRVVDVERAGYRKMVHGTTLHGATRLMDMAEGSGRPMPLTYYGEQGGLSIAIAAARENFGGKLPHSAVIGVGAGSLACRFQPGEKMDFYEIDPSVVRIAKDPSLFRFLSACGQDTSIVIGDGRIEVADVAPRAYGILVVDAFSSDAIPVHLMTREAIDLFMSKINDQGMLVMHISNNHLELSTVISAIGKSLGLEVRIGSFRPDARPEMLNMETGSEVAVLARNNAALGHLLDNKRWRQVEPGSTKPWTDGYSNVLAAMIRRYWH